MKHIKRPLPRPEFLKILILRTIGNFLIFSSIFMIIKTFYLPIKEEARYFLDQQFAKTYVLEQDTGEGESLEPHPTIESPNPKGALARLLNIEPVEVITPVDPNFSVVIPKIAANAPVLPNITTVEEDVYLKALQQGVAHAAGTAFPGEDGHIFLFAHSTDYLWNVGTYNAVFYLLTKLEESDEVNIFYKGQRYVYRVIDTRIVDPSQVEFLTRKTSKEFLTLQTCWPAGTTLKRLLVFATRVAE